MDYSAVKGVTVPAFLWRVHVQSGFKEGNRRMQCDHKPGIRPQRVDFCRHLGNPRAELSLNPFLDRQTKR